MVGEVIADRYELEEAVDHGGMSSVYRGHDRLLERTVALKVLHAHFGDDPEYVERFRREARAVAQLSHPNIVTVIDRGSSDGHQFIVFEYVEGENLKQLVERSGPLSVDRTIELGIQIADALAFAHAHELVHRDVKPQNVLIDAAGDAKVTDFGIARSLDVERGVTQTGTVLGTSNYLSPEQAAGEPVTPATDIYSLGVVLYELLTGEVPFRGDNLVVVAMKHVTEHPPSLLDQRADVPPRLARAVERALEKDPGRRFASMDAFANELRRCRDELGGPAAERTLIQGAPLVVAPPRAVRRVRPRRTGGHLPALLTLAGFVLLAIVVAPSLRRRDREQRDAARCRQLGGYARRHGGSSDGRKPLHRLVHADLRDTGVRKSQVGPRSRRRCRRQREAGCTHRALADTGLRRPDPRRQLAAGPVRR